MLALFKNIDFFPNFALVRRELGRSASAQNLVFAQQNHLDRQHHICIFRLSLIHATVCARGYEHASRRDDLHPSPSLSNSLNAPVGSVPVQLYSSSTCSLWANCVGLLIANPEPFFLLLGLAGAAVAAGFDEDALEGVPSRRDSGTSSYGQWIKSSIVVEYVRHSSRKVHRELCRPPC